MKLITFLHNLHGFTRQRDVRLELDRPSFGQMVKKPMRDLPQRIQQSPIATHYLTLFGDIEWDQFPYRLDKRAWPGPQPASPAPYVIAYLIRLDQGHSSMRELVDYLIQHPELVWLLGFPLIPKSSSTWGFDVAASVPTPNQFSQMLRRLPNQPLQFLLDETVRIIQDELPKEILLGETISIDTKHILAWVKENNPKAYIKEGRFDKTNQPNGDSDCKLGCKRRKNQGPKPTANVSTPGTEGLSASGIGAGIGEFYWGYASGVVATKVPQWGEFVLAELTQTFDKSDVSYFQPLMQQVEERLGRKPKNGTADAAFDAFYVYEYFHLAGGMAAVPFAKRGKQNARFFANDGALLCEAELPMFLKGLYQHRTAFVPHTRERWWCPLLHPEPNGQSCPIDHTKWGKEGCKITIAQSVGARLRHQIDRQSDTYLDLYRQRTAVERIFSRAVNLGIERPKLRNVHSITNLNTLIYVLMNLKSIHNIKRHKGPAD